LERCVIQLHKECIYNHNNISLTNYKGELIKFVIIFLIDSKYYLHHKHMSNVFSNSVHLNSSQSLSRFISYYLRKYNNNYGRGKFFIDSSGTNGHFTTVPKEIQTQYLKGQCLALTTALEPQAYIQCSSGTCRVLVHKPKIWHSVCDPVINLVLFSG